MRLATVPDGGEHMQTHIYGRNGSLVVAVSGEIDHHSAAEFTRAVLDLMDGHTAPVRLDLTGIAFIASAGLTELMFIRRAHGVTVDPGNPYVDRLIQLSGLEFLYGEVELETMASPQDHEH